MYGCGDSLSSACIARAYGASKVWLVDVGNFGSRDIRKYREMAQYLKESGRLDYQHDFSDFDDYLSFCKAEYLHDGIDSLSLIPDSSIDFLFSNAVLEHVEQKDSSSLLRKRAEN